MPWAQSQTFTLRLLLAGFSLAVVVVLSLRAIYARAARDRVEDITEHIKAAFGDLSLEALSRSTEEFLKLAKSRFDAERDLSSRELEGKKELIDRRLEEMTAKLEAVSSLVRDLEKDRESKFGELADRLREVSKKTAELNTTTGTLKEALSSSQARGQWGERMAEDILRLAGFVEGLNYARQKVLAGSGRKPDFTFFLPKGLTLNMDVKFPSTTTRLLAPRPMPRGSAAVPEGWEGEDSGLSRIIDPEHNTSTTPSYSSLTAGLFLHPRTEPGTIDDGLRQKVIFCSPITLYAVLAVIRQAVDNFTLEQTSRELLALFGAFSKQWKEFLKRLEHLGKQIEGARDDYENLVTTRRRGLDRPLERLEEIRKLSGLEAAPLEDPLAEDGAEAPPDEGTI